MGRQAGRAICHTSIKYINKNMSEKIIPDEAIPATLWSKNVLHPPAILVDAYEATLSALGLLDDAKSGTKEQGIHGGCGDDETRGTINIGFWPPPADLKFQY